MEVRTRCESIGDKSFRLLQILVEKQTAQIKSVCETVMVTFDKETGKAKTVPQDWINQFCEYEGRNLSVKK